ncbi:elongation factor Tu [Roseobacter sp. AzwK-3b]|nr:elongation factor Tu [Roseobacter sp. AzwK-3b]
MRFPSFAILLHLDAHGTRGAEDDFHRGVNIVRVQVFPLGFGDLTHLLGGHCASGRAARRIGPGLQLCGLLEVVRRRRRLDVHLERLVLVIGNHGRARRTGLHVLRLGVERLAEFHDVDATLTERRAHRGGRGRFACWHLQLHLACEFLGHLASPSFQLPSGRAPRGLSRVVRSGRRGALASHGSHIRSVW